ncbi:MAG TPA: alpha/beta hydrolase [Tepidisphaeraceae bacterium]|jgi:acetyl esterase/lipase|nr:alpha/beta hydrolase [Tepidisphaeraceae bacterium]
MKLTMLVVSALCMLLMSVVAANPRGTPVSGGQVYRDLSYGQPGQRRHLLDLYVPRGDQNGQPRPVIVWIHGGAWEQGDKSHGPGAAGIRAGYAIASVNYRLSQDGPFPAQIHDCKAAVRWLRANAQQYGLDPDRIGVWGASAGGHLAALLGTSADAKDLEGEVGGNLEFSSRVQAVCDWFGPTDLLDNLRAIRKFDPQNAIVGKTDAISRLLGGPAFERVDLARQANPATHVTPTTPPFLIMHGDQDQLVPLSQSQLLYKVLNAQQVEAELVVVKGGGHGDGPFYQPEQLLRVIAFFDRHLK